MYEMYDCLKHHSPKCSRTSQCLSHYHIYNNATERHESKHNIHECSCNKKFLKSQKWRRRYQQLLRLTSFPNHLLLTLANIIHNPSWMFTLTIAFLLVCCQGNHVQPAPATAGSELHDVMVPVGKAFYYKIPDSAFQCDVEHLMVTGSNDRFLPNWLTYNSVERKLYGIPLNNDIGTNSILIVAIVKGELNRGQICGSKTFEITVPPEGDTIPIPLMSAALQSASVGEDGTVQLNNPNLHHRIKCFPGVHATFASVLVNTDLNQLNGHQRINILQQLALRLGLSADKINAFSDQFPNPLISSLELTSVIAAGAGNGRFVKGIKTVFTWALGCGAIKVNETLISHLTKTSQDGTFNNKLKHSIFGWHITSGIQKTLPKIRVRRAPLIGTPTPTTTVAMPTAVSVSRTTVVYNGSVSLSRVLPSTSFSISLTPINSSSLPAQTQSTAVSSVELIATMTISSSPSDIQTVTTSDFIPSIVVNTTDIASQFTATSVAGLTLSPSTLSVSQSILLLPSPSTSFQTASLPLTPRTSSVVGEITTFIVEPNSTIGPIASISSTKALEQSLHPTTSRELNQTVVINSSSSFNVEPSTPFPTTVYQTSLIDLTSLKPSALFSTAALSDTSLHSSPKTLEQSAHLSTSRTLNQTVVINSSSSFNLEPSTPLPTTVYQTSLIDHTPLKPSSVSSTVALSDTSLRSSPKTLERSVHSMSSGALNQTIQIRSSASYTREPSTFLPTTVYQTSLTDISSLKPSSTPSAPPSITSNSTVGVYLTSLSLFISLSSDGTMASETSFSFVAHPDSSKSFTLFTNQTDSSHSDATIPFSSSKSSYMTTTAMLDTTSVIQVVETSSSVLLHQTKSSVFTPDLTRVSSTSTQPFNLSSVKMTKSSEEIDTTSRIVASPLNSTHILIPRTSSTATYLLNKTDATQTVNDTRSPIFTLKASSAVVTVPTSESISSLQVSSTVQLAESISPTSSRIFVTVNHTESQVLSASLSNSTHTLASESAVTLSLTSSVEAVESMSVSPVLNKTTVAVVTQSPISTIQSPFITSTTISKTQDLFTNFSVLSSSVSSAIISKTQDILTTVSSAIISKTRDPLTSFSTSSPLVSSAIISQTDLLHSFSVSSPLLFSSAIISKTDFLPSFTTASPLVSSSTISKTEDLSPSFTVPSPLVSSATISKTKDFLPSFTASSSLLSPSTISKTEDLSLSFTVSSPLVSSATISKPVDLLPSFTASSALVSSATSSKIDSLLTSFSMPSPIVSSKHSDKLKTSSANVTVTPSVGLIESTSAVIMVKSSSPAKTSSDSAMFVLTTTSLSTIQLVSPSPTDYRSALVTHVPSGSSSTTAVTNLSVTSDIMKPFSTPVPTQLSSSEQSVAVSSEVSTIVTSSLLPTTGTGISVLEITFTTDADTVTPTSRTGLSTQYLSSTIKNEISYSTRLTAGMPRISLVGTSAVWRSVRSMESSVGVATMVSIAPSSPISDVSSTVNSSNILAFISTVSTVATNGTSFATTHLSDLSSALSRIHSTAATLSSEQHVSPMYTAQSLSVYETESFIKVATSLSFQETQEYTGTKEWSLYTPTRDISVSSDMKPTLTSGMVLLTSTTTELSLKSSRHSFYKASNITASHFLSTVFSPSVTQSSLLQSLQTKSTMPNYTTSVTQSNLLPSLQTKSTMPNYSTPSVTQSSLFKSLQTKTTMPNYATFSVTKPMSLQSLQTKSTVLNYTTVSVLQQITATSSVLMHTVSKKISPEKTSVASQTVNTISLQEVSLSSESSLMSAASTKQAFSPSQPEKSPQKSTPMTWSADIVKTSSTFLPSVLPSVANVSADSSPTFTVIPTSIGPTLAPSTGPTTPPNNKPVRLNDIGRLEAKVGKVFRYVIPRDIFYDREDGDTRNLTLSCRLLLQGVLPSDYWLQFDSKRQELYGLPLPLDYEKYSGKEEYERYVLTAHDSLGLTARDVFQVVMIVVTDAVTQQLSIRTSNNYTVFTSNVTQRLDLFERIKTYYGDKDTSAIRIVSVTQGSLVMTWTNDTLPSDKCNKEAVQQISSKTILSEGEVNPAFRSALEPEFPIQNAKEERFGVCNETETFPTVPAGGQRSTSEADMWLKHVLPGILVALLLIILALILVFYLRRRRPKPSNPEKKTYRKRKPIVLGEEIEMKVVPAKPLILPDDDFSCPPSYLSETSLDKPQHYDTDDEDEVDFANKTPSIRYEPPPPFYPTYESPRDTLPPSYKLPPPYKF